MRILFCKIASMKHYKGVQEGIDEPHNGGSYIAENCDGGEVYNFDAISLEGKEGKYCLGFVETKSTRKERQNELHIENIRGCESLKNEKAVEDVLVVWCATQKDENTDKNKAVIVGWYQHATVYRRRDIDQGEENQNVDDDGDYYVKAKVEDCVLLPEEVRSLKEWEAPVAQKWGYGFGQALVWYARNENAEPYLKKLVKQIQEYDGENWIDVGYPRPSSEQIKKISENIRKVQKLIWKQKNS